MGRKKDNKGGEASNNKNAPENQQTQNPNPGGSRQQGGNQQGGAWRQQQEGDSGRTQQGGPRQQGGNQQGGARAQQQGGDSGRTQQGGPRQQGGNQQGGARAQQQGGDSGRTQQGGPRQQGGNQQGGAWRQQQEGDSGRTQQGGPRQEGGNQQGGARAQQQGGDGGRTQEGGSRQQGGNQQGGAWRQQQGGDGGRTQQGGSRQQGGAWGQQQGGDSGRTQQGGPRQQGGAWGQQQGGDGGRTQQGGSKQQGGNQPGGTSSQQQGGDGGRTQQGGSRQQGGAWGQQQGGDSGRTQQGGPRQQGGAWGQQQGGDGGRTQQGGSRQQGGNQQGGAWGQQQRGDGGRNQQDGSRQQGGAWDRQQGTSDERTQQGKGQQQYGRGQQQNRQQGGRPQGQYGRQEQQQQTLEHNMDKLSISNENPLPVKPVSCNGIVRGTLGNPGTVEVNYLRLNLDKMPNEAYHYDITITPDRPKKFLRPVFEQFNLQACPDVTLTFDGSKSCYSLHRLKSPMEVKVEVADSGNRKKEFVVELKETDNCVVDLKSLRTYQSERVSDKPMRALQVLEVILASNNHERGVRVGRSFFRRPENPYSLDDGYEAWTGLFQAAILGEMPLFNVDIAHKSFPCESTLIDYLSGAGCDLNRDLSNNYFVSSFLKGIQIVYSNPALAGAPPRSFKVLDIGEPASKKTFKNDAGQQLTIQQYFQSLGYKLKYPNLSCLTVGSTVKQISLPMELCSIASGQVLNRKDQPRQTERMVRYAATSTNLRKQKIMALLKYFDHNTNPIIRSFGLSLGSSFLKVPMRMLPSPYMEYLQGRTVTTFKGAWRMDNNKFLLCSKPPNGFKWAIFYEDKAKRLHHDLENFKANVIKTSANLNMNLQNSAEIVCYNFRQLEAMLQQRAKDGYDLVFVVLSDRGTTYAKIKQTAELQVGILTQCIKEKTVNRTMRDMTVFSNILLKVNGKLNGTNHKIAQDKTSNLLSPVKNVMYLGADVTHPSPDQRHIPSVVGVAASHDANGACYNCQYRLQRSTVENIEDMESIFSRHLEVYHKYQKSYPGQIIYYRDGVSDGQFPIVEREEIRAIKRACKKKGCDPKLTCVIVVKRHHTRFFPLTQPQNERDFNNVQAGTVVDQYITHPNEVQFFMVSHQSIQGTARPTRYNVIMDESKFDINLLQKLTYNLCHLFPRCNRAVSYPAPAYLAHLVAFRGRVYLEGTQNFGNLNREYERRQIKPDFMNKTPMYFI